MQKIYQAGIILHGGRSDENTLTLLTTMRLDAGWDLYQKRIIQKIILPGGQYSTYDPKAIKFQKNTAQLRKEYLLSKGKIKNEDIILAEGRDTIWEAFGVRKKATELGLNNLLLITSEKHMPRALFIFTRILGNEFKIDDGNGSGQVATGDILLEDEERDYLSLLKKVFHQLPEVIPYPVDWNDWYTKHQEDLYQEYKRIHDVYHPLGKESQAYVGVER